MIGLLGRLSGVRRWGRHTYLLGDLGRVRSLIVIYVYLDLVAGLWTNHFTTAVTGLLHENNLRTCASAIQWPRCSSASLGRLANADEKTDTFFVPQTKSAPRHLLYHSFHSLQIDWATALESCFLLTYGIIVAGWKLADTVLVHCRLVERLVIKPWICLLYRAWCQSQ